MEMVSGTRSLLLKSSRAPWIRRLAGVADHKPGLKPQATGPCVRARPAVPLHPVHQAHAPLISFECVLCAFSLSLRSFPVDGCSCRGNMWKDKENAQSTHSK